MSYFRASATVSGEYLTVNWNASVSSDISSYSIYYEIYINDSKEYESEQDEDSYDYYIGNFSPNDTVKWQAIMVVGGRNYYTRTGYTKVGPYFYYCYDLTNNTMLSDDVTGTNSSTVRANSFSNYNYLGYVYHTDEDTCLEAGKERSFDSTSRTCSNLSDRYPWVIFFYEYSPTYYAYITYHYNGGSGSYLDGHQNEFTNSSSSWSINLDTPSRSGYNFLGWTTDNSSSYVDNSLQVSNGSVYNLYAMWQQIYYYTYITYYYNGGTGKYSDGAQITYSNTSSNRTITLDTPTRTDYTFLGWGSNSSSADIGTTYSVSSTENVSKNVYAVWRRNTITVTYNANGGSGGPESYTVNTNSSFNINGTNFPTKSGYIFKGWSTSSTAKTATYKKGATLSIQANTSNITYYAVWWPAFTWKDYSRSEANTFAGYINTYLNSSITTINDTNPLRLVVWFNAITTALGNNIKVASGDASFKTQLDTLLTAYNNY